KAYEMMSCFEGLLEYYRVTKIEKWKTALINFANRVRLTEISVIGSSGCTHELFDHTLVRQVNTMYNGVLQETCVTVTWMKFCFQLLSLTGDSRFADEIERSTYNALMGAINFNKLEKNGGLPFDSYSPLLFNTRLRGIGGKKTMADGSFYGCCACIGAAGTGIIGKAAAMMSDKGIAVNTYSNGTVSYKTPSGEEVSLSAVTDYPASGKVTFTVMNDTRESSEIALRIPEWSEITSVTVNGLSVSVKPGEYARFENIWKKGDVITLVLDVRCRLIEATPDPKDENSGYHVSLRRGPLALARDKRLKGDIESVVLFSEGSDGAVPCELTDCADFEHFYSFTVTESNGNKIDMVDYASAGRTWDEESLTTVWMPTQNYWSVDLKKPINIVSPNSWNSSDIRFGFVINKDGYVGISTESADVFTLEAVGANGEYKIKTSSGKYLDISPDGEKLMVSESGSIFTVKLYAQNRYKIFDCKGRAVVGSNDPVRKPLISFESPSFATIQIVRFEQV
ncbi:MAG: glycoside hydrolase family 127 protein, partial [Clostridia bacterium]|nr:glycoside hydrolase family 127 protein [Clostridia bacterium]